MARDGLLLFSGFAGGSLATSGTKQTSSSALTISPFVSGNRRELMVRFTVNVTSTVGTPTGIGWIFTVEASDDATNFFTVCASPGQIAGATTTATFAQLPDGLKMAVTAGVADGGIEYYLPIVVPQSYVDSTGTALDNYNSFKVTATPIINGGTTPSVTYVSTAAIVSGKDGSYS